MKFLPDRVKTDLFLIITSLVMACVVWLIAKEGDLGQETLVIPLRLQNVPENIEARLGDSHGSPDSVQVSVSTPKSLAAVLQGDWFTLDIDWDHLPTPSEWCGVEQERSSPPITLSEDQIRLSSKLGEGTASRIRRRVQYLGVEPNKARVSARYITRPVRVRIETLEAVADGYRLAAPLLPSNPDRVIRVTAPLQRFEELGAPGPNDPVTVETEPVNLADRRETYFEILDLLPPEDVQLIPGHEQVEVKVLIEAVRTTRTVTDVPIIINAAQPDVVVNYTPRTASVTLVGPRQMVERVSRNQLTVRATQAPEELPETRVLVQLEALFTSSAPGELTESTRILRVEPQTLAVEFVQR